jgi:hypothetical protein
MPNAHLWSYFLATWLSVQRLQKLLLDTSKCPPILTRGAIFGMETGADARTRGRSEIFGTVFKISRTTYNAGLRME